MENELLSDELCENYQFKADLILRVGKQKKSFHQNSSNLQNEQGDFKAASIPDKRAL